MRCLGPRVTGGGAALALLLLLLAMDLLFVAVEANAAIRSVSCTDGTIVQIEPGLWSVGGATVQDNTPIASGGPNFIKVCEEVQRPS